jgi:hypothetical protein
MPIASEHLTSLISQLPPPFIFHGNSFSTGSDLLLLKSGAATCLSLGSETFLLEALPSVVHLADLHGSGHYPVNLHISTTRSQVF